MALLIICCAVMVLVLSISFYVYCVAFYSPKSNRCKPDDPLVGEQFEAVSEHILRMSHIMAKIPCEIVTITSYDGYQLTGNYYHVRDGAPIEILFHGYRSCALRDCSGGHALSRKMGFNALVVDQRAHGSSEGSTICFGVKERKDCLYWIEYVNNRFGDQIPIILFGLSMGAATVLMASDLKLSKNVACIIADSAYSAPGAIIEKVCSDLRYPVFLCRPFIHLAALLYGGFRLNGCTAKEAVAHSNVPILLLHGEDDRLVPCSMCFELAECCASPIVAHTFPEAGHGLSYLTDPIRYERVLYDFLQKIPKISSEILESFRNQMM